MRSLESTAPREEQELIRLYLETSKTYRKRRLIALIVLCLLLLIPLGLIYSQGWWDVAGGASVGLGWVAAVVGAIIAALSAVIIDILYRKEV